MTDAIYEQATELMHIKKILEKIRNIMTLPYAGFNIFNNPQHLNVDFAEIDNKTAKQLKEAILNVVEKRRQETEEELKQL